MKRGWRIALWIVGGLFALLLVLGVAGIFVVRSAWFHQKVLAKIVSTLEDATGGRVEIGSYQLDWHNLTATVAPITLHGTEPANQAPLLRADSVKIGLKIISLAKRDIDLALLQVNRPMVNLILDAQGNTNIPNPKNPKPKSDKDSLTQLLDLAVKRYEINNGLMQVADRKIPLNARGENLSATMDYDLTGPRYLGNLSFRQLTASTDTIGPLAANVDLGFLLSKGRIDLTKGAIALRESRVDVTGNLIDLNNPRATFTVNGQLSVPELGPLLKLDKPYQGTLALNGNGRYSDAEGAVLNASATGTGLRIHSGTLTFAGNTNLTTQATYRNSALAGNVRVASPNLDLRQGTTHVTGNLDIETTLSYADAAGWAFQTTAQGRGLNVQSGTTRIQGNLQATGKGSYRNANDYAVTAKVNGANLAVRQPGLNIPQASLQSNVSVTPNDLKLNDLVLNALGGTFAGNIELRNAKAFTVNGRLDRFSLAQLSNFADVKNLPYSGTVSGPVQVSGVLGSQGVQNLQANTKLAIVGGASGIPIRGSIDVNYDQRTGVLQVGQSNLRTPNSTLQLSGTLGSTLRIHLDTTNFDDFLPAIALATGKPPEPLPVKLEGGRAVLDATVTGPVASARAVGNLQIDRFSVDGRRLDRLSTAFDANPSQARVTDLLLTQGPARLSAKADVALVKWSFTDDSALNLQADLSGGRLAPLVAQAGSQSPVDGQLTANLQASGTLKTLKASTLINLANTTYDGDNYGNAQARLNYSAGSIDVADGALSLDQSTLQFSANFQHTPGDFQNGRIRFQVGTPQGTTFNLAQLRAVQKARPGIGGLFRIRAAGEADIAKGTPQLKVLNGDIGLTQLALNNRPIGDFRVNAQTNGDRLLANVQGTVLNSKITGDTDVLLTGDYPGSGKLEFSPIGIGAALNLMSAVGQTTAPPVDGIVSARASFSGPLAKTDQLRASLEIPQLEIRPASTPGQQATPDPALALRNVGPIAVELNGTTVRIVNAKMTGQGSNIDVAGTLSMAEKVPWDLRLNGSVNLAILRNFDPDITASGQTILAGTIRGTRTAPLVDGRLDIKNVNVSVANLPNGLSNANGTVRFDRTRATIERLHGETGGGEIDVTGFVGYSGAQAVYRLQALTNQVRFRQSGVSITVDSRLSLTGTTDNSLLSGTVTVQKAAFNSEGDVGGLLATSAKPVPSTPTKNPYLRNMRLDVRIESAPNLQLVTSLASNVQTEIALNVKGNPERPVVLGRVLVNQGQINFFGNKYDINRGEIGFFNPVKIEPVVDLDLETVARGITVTINFQGPLTKLNVTYRSDPPLQSSEIIALLTVGRDPNSNPSLAAGQTQATTSVFQTGTNTLVGQALNSQISNRVQKLFGVTKLKIDPLLTGLSNTPEARVTFEQQISNNLTLTFITNLTSSQQQIFRFQYDLSPQFSIIALRDENGIFGVDFQYRKRFR